VNSAARHAVILTATLLACVNTAQAQTSRRPNTRQGFWAGFGLGASSAEMDCSSCSNFRFTGPSGYVRLGYTFSRRILLGVESAGWVHSTSDIDDSIWLASVVALWYPLPAGALYVKLGYGRVAYHSDDGGDVLTAKARSASIGLGYEVRVRRNISVVPFLNGLATSGVQQYRNGLPIGNGNDFSINLIQFGLGVTFH
jgi:hypothetical protein